MAKGTPPDDDRFTNYEIGENAARELTLGAEELAEEARRLPVQDPRRISMTEAAAAALRAAMPFLDRKDRRKFARDSEKPPVRSTPPAAAA